MDKEILKDYIDACRAIKEAERELKQLKGQKKRIVQDKVAGSNPEFPFEARSFTISGTCETTEEASMIAERERILQKRKRSAEELKLKVEEWMTSVPFRMQRIIKYRVFEGESWERVAAKLGRKATGESVRKEYEKFMK